MSNVSQTRRSLGQWFDRIPFENASIIVPALITIAFEVFLLSRDIFWLRDMLGELFTAYFGVVGITSAALAQLEMVKIQRNVGHLVSMSLRPLEGFSEIFERAFLMLKDSDDELYFATFVGRFGLLHEDRAEVLQALHRLGVISGDQDLSTRVEQFEDLLIERVTSYRRLKLVLLEVPNLEALVQKINPDADVPNVLDKEIGFRKRLLASMSARRVNSPTDCVTVQDLPQQVLIARMRRPNGDRLFGCLVFLVGTETKIMEQPVGYYTEAPAIASVYIRYLEAIEATGTPLNQ